MSRSNYADDCTPWDLIRWRGAVSAATKGSRGQKLLRDMLAALDAMPVKRLIKNMFEFNGEVCALGCLGKSRGVDMSKLDPKETDRVAEAFAVAPALVREIVFMNDDDWGHSQESPEQCWARMRQWVAGQIKKPEGEK